MPDRIPEIKRIRDYVRTFLTTAKENGAILYYDINFRASHKDEIPELIANIEENMQLATVLRGSAEDFNILYAGFCYAYIMNERRGIHYFHSENVHLQ